MSILAGLLYFVFVLSSILLIAIVLLQEGKGGGLAEAFGGAGAETFGVKSGGINKATASIAAIFLISAIGISLVAKWSQGGMFGGDSGPADRGAQVAPSDGGEPADGGAAPAAGDGGAAPAAGDGGGSPDKEE